MSVRSLVSSLAALSPALLWTPPGHANTIVVDDNGGPGVAFTDIQPAVSAAAPGDLIVVFPGSYSSFVVDKGLTIVANGSAVVAGTISVQHVTTIRTLLAGLTCDYLVLASTPRVVIAENLTVRGSSSSSAACVVVSSCADVRFQRLHVGGQYSSGHGAPGMVVDGSRVELVRCDVRGRDGLDGFNFPWPFHGGDGIQALNGADVHLSLSTVRGGDGGDNGSTILFNTHAGDGGDALDVSESRVLVTGTPAESLAGGANGVADDFTCLIDGAAGRALRIGAGSTARVSGLALHGGYENCFGGEIPPISNQGTLIQPVLADPSLERTSGALVAGQPVTFVLHGAPGTQLRLRLGRRPIVDPLAPGYEDRLVEQLRGYDVGVCPPSGSLAFDIGTSSATPLGALLVFQALAFDGSGASELSASWPLIFH